MKVLLSIVAMVVLTACSTVTSAPPSCALDMQLPTAIQSLQRSACAGDKRASLSLGRYYESLGRTNDNEADLKRAVGLYSFAASSSTGQTFIYVPGAGKVPGYTMPVQTGPASSGLTEAKYRLAILMYEGLGIDQDGRKACKLFEDASRAGFEYLDTYSCS